MDEPQRAAQVELAASGDPDALQRLIVHYHAVLHRTVETAMGASLRRHFDPDDVLQQAYVAAFKSIAGCSFDGPGGFYKWLERAALNQLKDARRALKRQKRDVARDLTRRVTATTSYPGLLDRVAAPDSTPSRRLAKADAAAAVISCLARLTEDQRNVIRLRFLEGQSVPEVAAALGKSEPAVHMLCHRALKELRRLMVSITRYFTRL
jgi:RNA polymerase sigma-70 factor (ECF subfamily)